MVKLALELYLKMTEGVEAVDFFIQVYTVIPFVNNTKNNIPNENLSAL
jgi:hypothetical protein